MPLLPTKIIHTAQKAKANSVCLGWVDWPGAKSLFSVFTKFSDLKNKFKRRGNLIFL